MRDYQRCNFSLRHYIYTFVVNLNGTTFLFLFIASYIFIASLLGLDGILVDCQNINNCMYDQFHIMLCFA